MRILVCGSRHFNDEQLMSQHLTEYYMRNEDRTPEGLIDFVIIEGEARGADTLARKWAEIRNLPVWKFPADWKKYGKAAGPIRNKQMLDEGKPDLVLAFMYPVSRGTKNMVEQTTKAGIETKVINCD